MALAALAINRFCRSVAFFRTSPYTRFFSSDEAVRMKSENGLERLGLGFRSENIPTI